MKGHLLWDDIRWYWPLSRLWKAMITGWWHWRIECFAAFWDSRLKRVHYFAVRTHTNLALRIAWKETLFRMTKRFSMAWWYIRRAKFAEVGRNLLAVQSTVITALLSSWEMVRMLLYSLFSFAKARRTTESATTSGSWCLTQRCITDMTWHWYWKWFFSLQFLSVSLPLPFCQKSSNDIKNHFILYTHN